jgi:hypothetical protein
MEIKPVLLLVAVALFGVELEFHDIEIIP